MTLRLATIWTCPVFCALLQQLIILIMTTAIIVIVGLLNVIPVACAVCMFGTIALGFFGFGRVQQTALFDVGLISAHLLSITTIAVGVINVSVLLFWCRIGAREKICWMIGLVVLNVLVFPAYWYYCVLKARDNQKGHS